MKDAYARYTFAVGPRPGCSLTDRGYEALADALDTVMADALDGIYEKLRAAIPEGVDDAIQMQWQEEKP